MQEDIIFLSYNIQFGKASKYNIDNISKVIIDSGAHIIALQEVDKYLERSGSIDQVTCISENCNLPYYYFYTTVNHKQSSKCKEKAEFGIAVLSKYPIIDIIVKEYEYMKKGNEQRIALATKLDLNSIYNNNNERNTMWFINTHIGLDFLYNEQAKQTKELIEFLKEKELTNFPLVVICGDFNSFSAVCSSINTMKSEYNDAWNVYHNLINSKDLSLMQNKHSKGFGATFPAIFPLVRIDYFWLSKYIINHIEYIDIEVINTTASDHRPLLCKLKLD